MRALEFRLPHRGIGSATSTTFDFGANAPFTCVPAYCLPVYASQCPLPVHHARLSTWLLARLYQGSHLRLLNFMRFKAQSSQNRTWSVTPSGSQFESSTKGWDRGHG
jgi:hypothetical protein